MRSSAAVRGNPPAPEVEAPRVIAEVVIPANERGNRNPYFVARDVLGGDITQAVRSVVSTYPTDKDITLTVTIK